MSTQLSIKQYFQQPNMDSKLEELLGDNKVNYITSALQVISGNSSLVKCEPKTVFNAVAMAAVLKLPINDNLGHAYIIPYGKQAQFQIGYKGIIQLAIRSAYYKTINATPVYKGQLMKNDPLNGFEFDFTVKQEGDPIGYAAMFELKDGFRKTLFSTIKEIQEHGKKFSKTYDKANSTWKTNFDGMAIKTVIKALISKWGPMSLEMQKAVLSDQSVIVNSDSNEFEYPDNEKQSKAASINQEFQDAVVVEEKVDKDDKPKDIGKLI